MFWPTPTPPATWPAEKCTRREASNCALTAVEAAFLQTLAEHRAVWPTRDAATVLPRLSARGFVRQESQGRWVLLRPGRIALEAHVADAEIEVESAPSDPAVVVQGLRGRVPDQRWRLLEVLRESGPRKYAALAVALEISPPAAHERLRAAERAGLVERDGTHDAEWTLTAAGAAVLDGAKLPAPATRPMPRPGNRAPERRRQLLGLLSQRGGLRNAEVAIGLKTTSANASFLLRDAEVLGLTARSGFNPRCSVWTITQAGRQWLSEQVG